MKVLSAEETRNLLPFDKLVGALRDMFVTGAEAPLRHHHTMSLEGQPDATLLLMPSWNPNGLGGVKIVNVVPGNAAKGIPALNSAYLLFQAETGKHLLMLDGGEITNRRTVAASALAASYLAREDSKTLLVVGAGRVASNAAHAFKAVRDIQNMIVWDIVPDMAQALAARLSDDGFNSHAASDLQAAVGQADIISCATLATDPVILGDWLKPGQHLDLIGSFTPKMRETDDTAIRRARVYIDTDGVFKESGDIISPIESGALSKDSVQGDLFDLCRGETPGRGTKDEITLFKGVGTALEDLAAATLAYSGLSN